MTYIANRLQATDEQTIAQAELDLHIADQAEAVAPEELTTVQINDHHFEIFAGKRLIAYITYDHGEFVTQRWVVMVSGVEIFRYTTLTRCQRYVQWHLNNSQLPSRNSQLNSIPESREFASRMNQSPHHIDSCELRTANCELFQDGTLNPPVSGEIPEVPTISEICFYDHEALINGELVASISFDSENHEDLYWRVLVNNIEIFRDTTSARCHSYVKQQYQQGTLPVQEPFVEPDATENEIMCQICNACKQYGLELVGDHGDIYRDNVRLGRVGCTKDQWWFIRVGESQEKVPCNSAMDAVYWLSMVDTLSPAEALDYDHLLDLPFDQLTSVQWRKLLEYEPEYRALVAA